MIKIKVITYLVSALLSTTVIASQSAPNDPLLSSLHSDPALKTQEFFSPSDKAEWVANLPPTNGLIVTKIRSGQYMIVDANLRYAFYANNIFDILNGREITSPEQMNDVWLINTDKLSTQSLPIFSYGKNKAIADITIMMPMEQSDVAKNITDYIKKHQADFRIDIILMGTKNRQQLLSASNLYCAKDRDQAKSNLLNLIFPINSDKSTWLEQHVTCNAKDVISAMHVAKIYNVTLYPFSFNNAGASQIGLPDDLKSFSVLAPKDLANPQILDWEKFKNEK